MKGLFLDFTQNVGGAERSLISIIKPSEYQAEVLTLADGDFTDLLKASCIDYKLLHFGDKILMMKKGRSLRAHLSVLFTFPVTFVQLICLSLKFDFVYSNSYRSHFYLAIYGVFTSRAVLHVRDMVDESFYDKALVRMINISRCVVVANSCAVKRSLVMHGVKRKQIEVIYNGFEVGKVDDCHVRSSDCIRVGVFSRLSRSKGIDVAIRVVNKLVLMGLNVRCDIVGGSVNGEYDYPSELVAMRDAYGLNSVINFYGYVQDPHVYMDAVDFVLLPTIMEEPFGRVAVEGMLMRKIVVASRVGGIPEIIDDCVNGFLFEPGDYAGAADIMLKCFTGHFDVDSIVSSALSSAVERFSQKAMIDRVCRLIQSLSDDCFCQS